MDESVVISDVMHVFLDSFYQNAKCKDMFTQKWNRKPTVYCLQEFKS